MKGPLSEGVLPGLLRDLYVGRKSGLLHCDHGDVRRSVRLRRGNIIHAHSTRADEHLGETLTRQGRLSSSDLERATFVVTTEKRRLGQVLIDLGLMNDEALEDALAMHAREVLLKAFSAGTGTYEFDEQPDDALPSDIDVTLRLSTGEMILETVRRVQDPTVVRHALGDLDRVLVHSTDPLLKFQKVTLTPADGYILSRVDGTLSVREIIQLIPMAAEEVERSIFGLLCIGIVEHAPGPAKPRPQASAPRPPQASAPAPAPGSPRPAAARPTVEVPSAPPAPDPEAERQAKEARRREVIEAYEGLGNKNHFEVLGIPKASNEAQVKEAYFRLARRFHPDAHHDKAMVDLRDKLEAVFIRLGEAYEVLRNPRTRSAYETDLASRTPRFRPAASPPDTSQPPPPPPPPPDPEAEMQAALGALRKAEALFEQEKYWDVIQLLEPAIPRLEKKAAGRAQLLLGRAYAKNPKWTRQTEQAFKAAVEADPTNVDAHVALGDFYRDHALKSRAAAMYRKVLDLRPDHEHAARQLEGLGGEEPPPPAETRGGGLLKKLFGRG